MELIADRYQLIARIGGGGMGEVFRAKDTVLSRTVAIKILPHSVASSLISVERFRREAQAAARISHTNVVSVHDWGETEGTYYMVMEYLRGRNLREVLGDHGVLEPRQACQVIDQVLSALSAAHAEGLVHRDIKPENILLSTEGIVKVTDFGIAHVRQRTSSTGGLLGTVAYIAPEQARGEPVDARTDIYATGCVLYELLVGAAVFEGDVARVLYQHLNERVPSPEITADLDRVVMRATEPKADNRYETAQQMRSDVVALLPALPEAGGLAELTHHVTSEVDLHGAHTIAGTPVVKRKGRLKWVLAALLLSVLAVGAFLLRPVAVLDVTGLPETKARATLISQGLDVEVKRRYFLDEQPGRAVATIPSAGATVRRRGTVQLVISLGPELTDVPSLLGLSLDVARAEIRRVGLREGSVTQEYRPEPTGTVVDQSVKPGRARKGEPVNLVVSKGPEMVAVPDVIGKTSSLAQATLKENGFQISVEEVFDDAPAGTVVAQDPSSGSVVAKGSRVTVKVSKGSAPFAMPNVKGKSCASAKSQLESLGLVVVVRLTNNCGEGKVAEQDPFPDSMVRKGDEAIIYIG